MTDLVDWIEKNKKVLPYPVRAAIAHYQLATIHPYYDGNGRTARLFATLILHSGNYDLNGFYSLEEYYGRNLSGYYKALTIGPSHNYYLGKLDSRQRKVLTLFYKQEVITAHDIAELFGLKPRTARSICQKWIEENFIVTVDPTKKSRRYKLHEEYEGLVS